MSYPTNTQALLNLLESSQKYGTQKDTSWAKFNAGTHRIRLLPAWSDEGIPTRMIINHQGYKNKDGFQRNPLCFHYAFSNENIGQALIAKKVVRQEDFQFYAKFGCIYCVISDLLVKTRGKANNKTYPKAQFLWNIINRADNQVYKWTTSKKLFEGISMFASAYPNMFNVDDGMDIFLMATGEGITRKYAINMIPTIVPAGIDLSQNPLHDLDQAMADGYRNLNETMELLINTFPELLPVLGINPAQYVTGNPTGIPF